MLLSINIKNYVIAESIELNFTTGMTVLTGETGAGKSILLDALGLVLGGRADAAAVRHGTEQADVSACFDIQKLPELQTWLEEHDLNIEDSCYLRRVVNADGRSRAYINSTPVPISLLRKLGEQLVDIHGQHEHQSLTNRATQLQIIDRFTQLDDSTAQLKNLYREWQTLHSQLQEAQENEAHSSERSDLLEFQIDELRALNLQADEYPELCQRHDALAHLDETILACQQSWQIIAGDQPGNLSDQLQSALQTLADSAERTSEIQAVYATLQEVTILLDDAGKQLRRYTDDLDSNPAELAELEERLRIIHDLSRKHRCEPATLANKLTELEKEYEALESVQKRINTLQDSIQQCERAYHTLANKVSEQRQKTCVVLSNSISECMQLLGMGGGRFEIALSRSPDRMGPTGMDQIEFLVAANPGQPSRPLAKVASGGELSRISLALQVTVAGSTTIPTLIFDEVDSGIGGQVAEIVGQQLRKLGSAVQVICVTHLAQVASQAQQHICVSKSTDGQETLSALTELDYTGRLHETARMLGGISITSATLEHAKEMIERSQKQNSTFK